MRTTRATAENELNSKAAAQHLGVHSRTILRMIQRGVLTPCRSGERNAGHYFDKADLDRLIEEGFDEQKRVRNRDLVDPETMISTVDAIKDLDVTRQTLWRWEQEGAISGFRSGNRVYYDRRTIEALAKGRKK